MDYEIRFCADCYLGEALEISGSLLEAHAHDEGFVLRLVCGESGQFDVHRDGRLVHSKADKNRLPKPEEIEQGLGASGKITLLDKPGKSCSC
jgi:predicted Rdx family selenoprotein